MKSNTGWIALLISIVTATGGVLQVWLPLQKLKEETPGSLAEGQKLCRAVWPDHFTDGLIVPKNWSPDNCAVYASKVGGTEYWLGCIRPNSVEFGTPAPTQPSIGSAGKPADNCGW
jgi:hypothetical protein